MLHVLIMTLELLKIKTYRAPRDKIICVLNCCKVIFGKFGRSLSTAQIANVHTGLLNHSKSDSSADSFMPLLIYVVLQANPEHLVSNVQYILRFRNQEKLGGEAGYYLSSLVSTLMHLSKVCELISLQLGAVQFIENLDRTTLTISDEEFEQNVEAAVSAIAEKHQMEAAKLPFPPPVGEKTAPPRQSLEAESSATRQTTSQTEYESGEGLDEKAAVSGLFRTIQQPFTTIGRIFSEESSSPQGPPRTPLSANSPRAPASPRISADRSRSPNRPTNVFDGGARSRLTAEDSAARQASAEAAEAQRIQRAEHSNVVETLAGMFPDLDREVISDVVTQKEGRVGLAVDACLALSS
jgi:Rab5 GDP/GTP exchange factor